MSWRTAPHHDAVYPVICLVEAGKKLHDVPRGIPPLQDGQPIRQDDAYERHGVANLFLAIVPLRGSAKCKSPIGTPAPTATLPNNCACWRTRTTPQAQRIVLIVLVVDNLTTYRPGTLYEDFDLEEVYRLAARFAWHDTTEHGSWLNIAECNLSVLARQYLDRRIPDKNALDCAVAAWEVCRNQAAVKVIWQFTIADARIKVRRPYPVIPNAALGIPSLSIASRDMSSPISGPKSPS